MLLEKYIYTIKQNKCLIINCGRHTLKREDVVGSPLDFSHCSNFIPSWDFLSKY